MRKLLNSKEEKEEKTVNEANSNIEEEIQDDVPDFTEDVSGEEMNADNDDEEENELDDDSLFGRKKRNRYRTYVVEAKSEFDKEAELMAQTEAFDKNDIFSIYTESTAYFIEDRADRLLELGLSSQGHICSSNRLRVRYTPHIAVYRKNASGLPELLWKTLSYKYDKGKENCPHLKLKNLKAIFPEGQITLGLLQKGMVKAIAWQVKHCKKVYYIPWHNGTVIEDKTSAFSFTEHTFEEVKRTYSILRFAKIEGRNETYRVTLG